MTILLVVPSKVCRDVDHTVQKKGICYWSLVKHSVKYLLRYLENSVWVMSIFEQMVSRVPFAGGRGLGLVNYKQDRRLGAELGNNQPLHDVW